MVKTNAQPSYKKGDLEVDFEEMRKAFFAIRAVNHGIRQQILNLLHKNEEMTVSDIYAKLKLEQSQTSNYLAILRRASVVIARREGQSIYYSVNYKHLSFIEKGAKIINRSK